MKKQTKIIIFAAVAMAAAAYYWYVSDEDDDGDDDDDDDSNASGELPDDETDVVIDEDYLDPEILLNEGEIYKGEIPSGFAPDFEIDTTIGANLQDQAKVESIGFDQYQLINAISLTTGEEFLIGGSGNEFDVTIRYVNALTYALKVTRNFTEGILDGVVFDIDGEEISVMLDEVYYQFSEAGVYPINVVINTSEQDQDMSGQPVMYQTEIDFEIQVSSSSNYASGTVELGFSEFLIAQANV